MPSLTEDYNMILSSAPKKRKHVVNPVESDSQSQCDSQSARRPPRVYLNQQPGGLASLTNMICSHHNSDATPNTNSTFSRKTQILPLKKRVRTVDADDHRSRSLESHHPVPPSNNLSPCHICHRKPQRKADLDSYKDCEGCERQTCYICIRECHNWMLAEDDGNGKYAMLHEIESHNRSFQMKDADDNSSSDNDDSSKKPTTGRWKHKRGHRSIICSKCCVETGPEGETMCMACLDFVDEGKNNNR